MTNETAAELRARVYARLGLAQRLSVQRDDQADAAAQASLERLLAQLHDEADSDSKRVDRLIAQYRSGSITLTQLVARAQQTVSDSADDELDDLEPGRRGNSTVLRVGAVFGVLAGLSVIGHSAGEQDAGEGDGALRSLSKASTERALTAAAASRGVEPNAARIERAYKSLDERVFAVIDTLNEGDISGPQAASQIQTIVENANWLEYQQESQTLAKEGKQTKATYVLDEDAQHCDDCLERAANSPYDLDEMPGLPGDGSTECGPGDKCDVEYSGGDEEGE